MSLLPPIEDSGNPYLGSLPSISCRIFALADYLFQTRQHSLKNHPFAPSTCSEGERTGGTLRTKGKSRVSPSRPKRAQSSLSNSEDEKPSFSLHEDDDDEDGIMGTNSAERWCSDAASLATSFPHVVLYTEKQGEAEVIEDITDYKLKYSRRRLGRRNLLKNVPSKLRHQMFLKTMDEVLDTSRIQDAFFKYFFYQVLLSTSVASNVCEEEVHTGRKCSSRSEKKKRQHKTRMGLEDEDEVEDGHGSPSCDGAHQTNFRPQGENESAEQRELRELLCRFFSEAHRGTFEVLQALEGDVTVGIPPIDDDDDEEEDDKEERREGCAPSSATEKIMDLREVSGNMLRRSTFHEPARGFSRTGLEEERGDMQGTPKTGMKPQEGVTNHSGTTSSNSLDKKESDMDGGNHLRAENSELHSYPGKDEKRNKRDSHTESELDAEEEEMQDSVPASSYSSSFSSTLSTMDEDDSSTTVESSTVSSSSSSPSSSHLFEPCHLDVSSALQFFMSLAFSCPSTCISTATNLVLADVVAKRKQLLYQASVLAAGNRSMKRYHPHRRSCRYREKKEKTKREQLYSSATRLPSGRMVFRNLKHELAQLHLWESFPKNDSNPMYARVNENILGYMAPSSFASIPNPAGSYSSTTSFSQSILNLNQICEKEGINATREDFLDLDVQERHRHVRFASETLQLAYSGCENARVVMLTPRDTVLWIQRDGTVKVGSGKDWRDHCQREIHCGEDGRPAATTINPTLNCTSTLGSYSTNNCKDTDDATDGLKDRPTTCNRCYSHWECWCRCCCPPSRVVGYIAPRRCSEELPILQHMLLKNEEEAAVVMKMLALRAASPFFHSPAGPSSSPSSATTSPFRSLSSRTPSNDETSEERDARKPISQEHRRSLVSNNYAMRRDEREESRRKGGKPYFSFSYSPFLCLALSQCQLVPPSPFALTRKEILGSVFRDCGECPSYYPLLASSSPPLLLSHHQTQRFLFFEDGPLSIETRLMVAIMAASHHGCRYLVRRYAALFWLYISRVPADQEEDEDEDDFFFGSSDGANGRGRGGEASHHQFSEPNCRHAEFVFQRRDRMRMEELVEDRQENMRARNSWRDDEGGGDAGWGDEEDEEEEEVGKRRGNRTRKNNSSNKTSGNFPFQGYSDARKGHSCFSSHRSASRTATLSWLERRQRWLTHGPPFRLRVVQKWIALAAHQPWCATISDVQYCVNNGWSISSIVHLTAIVANTLSLTSFVMGLIVHSELWTSTVLPQALVDRIDHASYSYQEHLEAEKIPRAGESKKKQAEKYQGRRRIHSDEVQDDRMASTATSHPSFSPPSEKADAGTTGVEMKTVNNGSKNIFMYYTGEHSQMGSSEWTATRGVLQNSALPTTTTSAMLYSPKLLLWSSEFDWQESGVVLMDQYYPHAAGFFLEEGAHWLQVIEGLTPADAAGATLAASVATPVIAFVAIRNYVMKLLGYITSHYNFEVINSVVRQKAKALAQRMVLAPENFLFRHPLSFGGNARSDNWSCGSILPLHYNHHPYNHNFNSHDDLLSKSLSSSASCRRSPNTRLEGSLPVSSSETATERTALYRKQGDQEKDENDRYVLLKTILRNVTHEMELKNVGKYACGNAQYCSSVINNSRNYYLSTRSGFSAEEGSAVDTNSRTSDIVKRIADLYTPEEKTALEALLRMEGFLMVGPELKSCCASIPLSRNRSPSFDEGEQLRENKKICSLRVAEQGQEVRLFRQAEEALHWGLTLNKEKLKLHIATTVMIARRDAVMHHLLYTLSSYLHVL